MFEGRDFPPQVSVYADVFEWVRDPRNRKVINMEAWKPPVRVYVLEIAISLSKWV